MNFRLNYKIVGMIFLLGLILRIIFLIAALDANEGKVVATVKGDDAFYEISQNLVAGHGFSSDDREPYTPNPLRPPLQPLILAGLFLIFQSPLTVALIHMIIGCINIILGMYVVHLLFESKKITVISGIVLAVEPYLVLFSNLFYSETLFIFFFLLFLIFLFKYFKDFSYRSLIFMAVFLSGANLIKPTVQYVPFIIIAYVLWIKRKAFSWKWIQQMAVFALIFLALMTPWFYRNYKDFGVVGMGAQPAFNLYIYLVPSVLSVENNTSFSYELEKLTREDGVHEREINLSTSKKFTHRAIEILQQHPLGIFKITAISWITFFTNDGLLTVFNRLGIPVTYSIGSNLFSLLTHPTQFFSTFISILSPSLLFIGIGRLVWIVITLLFFAGIILLYKEKKLTHALGFSLMLVFYFMGTTTINGLGVNARFRMPVNAIIISLALFALLDIVHRIRKI